MLHCAAGGTPPPFLPQLREEAEQRERAEDQRYMAAQAAQLDKQERQRQQLLERVRAVQVGIGPVRCVCVGGTVRCASAYMHPGAVLSSSPSPSPSPPVPEGRTARRRMQPSARRSSAGSPRK